MKVETCFQQHSGFEGKRLRSRKAHVFSTTFRLQKRVRSKVALLILKDIPASRKWDLLMAKDIPASRAGPFFCCFCAIANPRQDRSSAVINRPPKILSSNLNYIGCYTTKNTACQQKNARGALTAATRLAEAAGAGRPRPDISLLVSSARH